MIYGFVGLDEVDYLVADSHGNESAAAKIRITVLDMEKHPWQNPIEPLDVNADGLIVPGDALIIINHLNAVGSGRLEIDIASGLLPPAYLDTSGDDHVSPAGGYQFPDTSATS